MRLGQIIQMSFKSDFFSSIVVFLVAIPLCLGIAVASGAPPLSGLLAGVIGGIVVGIFSGAPLSVSGPAAGLTVIVLNALETLSSFEAFLLAVFLAGIIQLILGFLKAGIIGYFFPISVIRGMLSAIGLILIITQIPLVFGYLADNPANIILYNDHNNGMFSKLIHSVLSPSIGAVLISAVSFILYLLFESRRMKAFYWISAIPTALLVVVTGVFINQAFIAWLPSLSLSSTQLVNIPVFEHTFDLFKEFKSPDWTAFAEITIYKTAITIAIIASIETLLSVEAADQLDEQKRITPPNRELRAQGIGNMLSGLVGGLPITAVIVRSAANINAGGKTKASTILHGFWILLSILFIAPIINRIPLASLAVILVVIGYKLVTPKIIFNQYRLGASQFVPFMVTIIAVLLTDLLVGIGIGILFSLYYVIKSHYGEALKIQREDNRVKFIFGERVSFLNKAEIGRALAQLKAGDEVEINLTNNRFLDSDIRALIQNIRQTARKRDIALKIIERKKKSK